MTFVQLTKVKTKVIQVNLNQTSNIDMINSHKQIRDIVSNILIQTTVDKKKMKNNILKLENELHKEKNFNKAKSLRNQEIEAKIVSIGSNFLASYYLEEMIE